ncbi:MAG: hypothetical protein ACLFTR_01905 [Candidatus Woesearchaeota archaeon]
MNLIDRIISYRKMDDYDKETLVTITQIYTILKTRPQGVKAPPRTYRPRYRTNNLYGRAPSSIIPSSQVPLEERVKDIPHKLKDIFYFTIKNPEYDSRRLRYVLHNYSMMYNDFLDYHSGSVDENYS